MYTKNKCAPRRRRTRQELCAPVVGMSVQAGRQTCKQATKHHSYGRVRRLSRCPGFSAMQNSLLSGAARQHSGCYISKCPVASEPELAGNISIVVCGRRRFNYSLCWV